MEAGRRQVARVIHRCWARREADPAALVAIGVGNAGNMFALRARDAGDDAEMSDSLSLERFAREV
jgi:hypothetical protein